MPEIPRTRFDIEEDKYKNDTGYRPPLHQTIVKRERRDNGLVALGALLELSHVEATVLVLVHHPEDLTNSLLGRVFVFGEFDH